MTTKKRNLFLTAACSLGATAMTVGVLSGATLFGLFANADAAEGKITGATLTLGSSISVRYYAESSQAESALTMRFTMNGKESAPVAAETDADGAFYFDCEVAPQCMGEDITAALYKDETKIAEKTYSVASYCKAKIADETADEDLKTLCADILSYGAAMQIYADYNTDALVNADGAGTPSTFAEIQDTDKTVSAAIDENTGFTAATCWFDNINRLWFLYKTDDNSAVSVSLTRDGKAVDYSVAEQSEGLYAIISEDICAADFDGVYSATLTKGEKTQTATYSLKSYVYSMQNKENETGELTPMANLSRALWNYGASSRAWYYTPILSETEESVTVKAGATFGIPVITATNRAGETLTVSATIDGEDYTENNVTFYTGEEHDIVFGATSPKGYDAYKALSVLVDYEGVNLSDPDFLTTAEANFYGMYGATFVAANGEQHIGAFEGKKVYDERISIGISVTSFVGSMGFNIRGGKNAELDTIDSNTSFTGGGANNCTGLWVQVENSGGGRVRIRYGSGSILMDTDETMPDYKGNSNYWDAILQKSFRLDMQATDVKDESGKVTAVKVMVWLNNVSMTGEDGFEIQNDGSHDEAFKSGWLSLHAGSNTDWMKADAYIHSIYLNTPDYPENLLLSGWRTTNSSGGVSMVIDETGIPYANDNNADTDNTYEEWTRSYMDYGCYEGEKVKDQKIRITAKAAFTSGDDFCVYFRGNNYSGNGWRWIRRGFFLSFSADNGVRICFGEAAFSYGGETRVYTTYDNDLIKGIYGKTLSELFAEGVTLEMQATDVKDESGNVTAVNIKIWINGKLIDNNGYDATEFTDYSMDGTVGADIFKEGYLILGGKITDSEGYISGVYLEEV